MSRVVIVSDFHYALDKYLDEKTRSGRKLMQYAQPLLERLIREVNETIRSDFVVNLGDLIQDYGDYDEDVTTLKDFWAKFRGFDAPVFKMDKSIDNFYDFTKNSFSMENYKFHEFDFEIPMAI